MPIIWHGVRVNPKLVIIKKEISPAFCRLPSSIWSACFYECGCYHFPVSETERISAIMVFKKRQNYKMYEIITFRKYQVSSCQNTPISNNIKRRNRWIEGNWSSRGICNALLWNISALFFHLKNNNTDMSLNGAF